MEKPHQLVLEILSNFKLRFGDFIFLLLILISNLVTFWKILKEGALGANLGLFV
jgi:hypothetical protein